MSLAKFQYLPEILVPYDQLQSYFPISEKEDPVLQRGAVFTNAYRAITSESESKVRRSSAYPQRPAFQPPGALRVGQILLEASQNLSNTAQK